MSKPTQRKIEDVIEDLIVMWGEWMVNHKIVNDTSISNSDRRVAGLACETLQEYRQKLIREIDDIVEGSWIPCE